MDNVEKIWQPLDLLLRNGEMVLDGKVHSEIREAFVEQSYFWSLDCHNKVEIAGVQKWSTS